MLQNPHVLLTFDKVHNPFRLPREMTSERPKVVQACGAFHILTSKCTSRHKGAHFFDIGNFQKWREDVFLTFWLLNELRATTVCTFMHFLDISTSKSGPRPPVFNTFDFEMCFAPQRRALFRHLNVQKWSENGVFCTFWLGNVLRATTACNCSSLIWPDGSAPAALASLLFEPMEPQIIEKNTVFRDFPTFSRTWIFFLRRLSLLNLLSSSLLWLFPSLLFICPYCRKFDF